MNSAFGKFMETSCLALAREVPEFPTQMGLFEIAGEPVPQHYFSAIDDSSVVRRQQLFVKISDQLSTFPRLELDESEQLSGNVLEFLMKFAHERGLIGMAGKDFLRHEYLLRPSVGLQSDLPLFLTDLHPMRHEGDVEDYLSRLRSIASHLDEAGRQQQKRPSAGLLPPAMVLRDTVAEIEQFISTPVEKNILFLALAEKSEGLPSLDSSARTLLLQEAARELAANTYPAYQRLVATLGEQAPVAPELPGVWQLPGGDDWYEFMLQAATTTYLSADEIHEIGMEETWRLELEIIRTCRGWGIDADTITECHRAIDANKGPPAKDNEKTRQAIVNQVTAMMADIEPQLQCLFHAMPKGRVTVKPIARFAEASRNQSYQPPSLDGSRAGFFELNVGQLLDEADYELAILVYHEIFPGHHLQIALAQETRNLPSLRRILTLDAYIEGWAKYAEIIPSLHGINNDPKFHVARMRRELISTINLALDTGIHGKRWSEQKAMQFFMEHTGKDEKFARYMVHRSASVPAQMCSYKIGMMKMLELRKKMENALGDRFDVRDFHHAVLSRGAVPLALLDSIVDRDIGRLKKEL